MSWEETLKASCTKRTGKTSSTAKGKKGASVSFNSGSGVRLTGPRAVGNLI